MRHLNEDELILCHYGEAGEAPEFMQHLAACPACRSRMEDIRSVLALLDAVEAPERSADYGVEVWERLHPRLQKRRSWFGSFLLHPPRWALAGAMATLVIGAFILGRYWPKTEPQPVDFSVSAQGRERVLLASLDEHLERSQRLLMEIVNTPRTDSINTAPQRNLAEDLIESNLLYRQTAERVGEVGIANVLEELERVLMEIAHTPAQMSAAEMGDIQERIDSQGILFKVRVMGLQVRQREKAARELSRRTS
jgi:hypothetical protein